jgi:TRAP-type C4-dicarboxylate transport system permease small subunit
MGTVKDVLIHGFTAAICGFVCWHSYLFVRTSHEFGDLLLDAVPAWLLQVVLPVGFGLICYRYALFTVRDLWRLWRGGTGP